MSDRKVLDCRNIPNEKNCTAAISGTEEEILPMAYNHAFNDHGYEDTPEMRDKIKEMLVDEK